MITYKVQVDWNGDGDFTDAGEDVTSRVLNRAGMSVAYGRDQARAGTPTRPGTATFTLDNRTRDYSPDNTSSPLTGLVGPGREVVITATYLGVDYTLYRGFLDDFEVLPAVDERSVRLSCIDALGRLAQTQISTALYSGIRTGTAFGYILDAIDWPEDQRDLDVGASLISWWWEDNTDAASALERVVNSEGLTATAFIGADGTFVFRDRHSRLLRSASATSQATFQSGSVPSMSPPLVYDAGWRDVINSVTYSVDERRAADLQVVWESDATHSLSDGESILITVECNDPFFGAIEPVEDTDYDLLSGTVEMTLTRDSGQSTTIVAKATGGAAVFRNLQLRACPVTVARTIQVSAEDSASIDSNRRRSNSTDAPWANRHDAKALAEITLAHRAQRLPVVSMRVVSSSQQNILQQLGRDLLDRVTIIEPETSVNGAFWVEQIQHQFTTDFHETTFGCEKVPTQPTTVFTFDVAGHGFNDGVFGRTGLSDPATMFLFDTSGHGFNDGAFAY